MLPRTREKHIWAIHFHCVYSQIKPTNNPPTQHILETISTATCFGCINSYHQAVHIKINPLEYNCRMQLETIKFYDEFTHTRIHTHTHTHTRTHKHTHTQYKICSLKEKNSICIQKANIYIRAGRTGFLYVCTIHLNLDYIFHYYLLRMREIRRYELSGKSLEWKTRYRRKVSFSSSSPHQYRQVVTKLGHIARVEF